MCTHTHAQARVQTMGMHTYDTELGMESSRQTLRQVILSREMPTVLCSLTRGDRKAVWPQSVKPTWVALKGPVG